MVNYQNGKIYRIVCNVTGLQYIGSTTQPLSKRLSGHKVHHSQWKAGKAHYITVFKVIEGGDVDIVLIENAPSENKEELHRAERKWIESSDCVNKSIPTRSDKEWREANTDKLHQYMKVYAQKNADKIKDYQKAYRKKNGDQLRDYKKAYDELNQDAIKNKRKTEYTCECGSTFAISEKARHERSQKHNKWVDTKTSSSFT